MIETKGHGYAFNMSWIEFKAPNAQGVYCLLDKGGKVIFIGKGNIRDRLLSHWNRETSDDEAILNHAPAFFRFELTDSPTEREVELIRQLKPSCNPVAHSRFPKFW
jgi:excinuclease UvrABC nuclease subunit